MSTEYDPPHWKCPDCFTACYCVGVARRMPHVRCGTARIRDAEEASSEGDDG